MTIITLQGSVEFQLRVRTLLVMCCGWVRALWDSEEGSMFVMISSILDAYGRPCPTVLAGWVPPCSAAVAPDTLAGVSRPEVL